MKRHLTTSTRSTGRVDLTRTTRGLLLSPPVPISPRLNTNESNQDECEATLSLCRTMRPPSLLSSSPCCGYTALHVNLSPSSSGIDIDPEYKPSPVIDWSRRRRRLLAIKGIFGCGRDKLRGCERCRRHYGLPTYHVWARGGGREEDVGGKRPPVLMFQGSEDSDLASFLGLDSVQFVEKWVAKAQDKQSPSQPSHNLADLLIRPGVIRPGFYSSLPLSDPDSVDQIEVNDDHELELLTREGRVRKDMTPWRRAAVARKAKESNRRLRGMQVHQQMDAEEMEDDGWRPETMKMRKTMPVVIERRKLIDPGFKRHGN